MNPQVGRRTFLAGTAAGALVAGAADTTAAATTPRSAGTQADLWTVDGNRTLQAFDYAGVRLLESPWLSRQEQTRDYYLAVPNDNYLRGFRARAGLQAPGDELGGWYSDDFFNPFGQIVSGLARSAAGSGSNEAAAKVHDLVAGFDRCIRDDGYFFYSDRPNALHYGFDKVLCGLLDASTYVDDEVAQAAIGKVTTWAEHPDHLVDATWDYAYAEDGTWTEWYTLSENLYRAYLATGDERYKTFAAKWEYRGFWDRFHRQENFFQTPDGQPQAEYHAYSHVNSLNGLGAGYLATGDEYYLTALRNAYDMVRESQCFVTGGYGPYEHLRADRDYLAAGLERGPWSFETQCGSWAIFKLCKYLLEATGNARYGDWVEEIIYNGIGASEASEPDGRVMYHMNYSSRGGVKRTINPWSCCSGTRGQAIADYSDLVFLHGRDELLVNLFLPSSGSWQTAAGPLSVRVETAFPADPKVELVLDGAPNVEFTVGFRLPEWLAGHARLWVNGTEVDAQTDDRNWIIARRAWASGDRITVELPSELRSNRFDADRAFPTAATYGPVSLAFQTTEKPATDGTDTELLDRLERVDGLHWSLDGNVNVVPFYEVPKEERYFLYVDPDAGVYIDLPFGWHCGDLFATENVGLAATADFDGTGVRFRYELFDDAGFATVEIDGQQVAKVDQYTADRGVPAQQEYTGLSAGRHTIRVTCSGEQVAESKGHWVNVIDFDPLA